MLQEGDLIVPTLSGKKSQILSSGGSYASDRQFDRSNLQLKDFIQSILAEVDIQINGDRPWDIQVHNTNLYQRVISQGSLGLGEAYVEGWWDCSQLMESNFIGTGNITCV